LTRLQPNKKITRGSITRDISYREDIAHSKNCARGDIVEAIKTIAGPSISSGTATVYAKHRRAESMGKVKSCRILPVNSYPTEIKQLEKIIQYTGPNHRNIAGGRACTRESCIDNIAFLSPKNQTDTNPDK
jgi:hypothetical protein